MSTGCCGSLHGGQPLPCPVPALAPGGSGVGSQPQVGGRHLVWATMAVRGSGRVKGLPCSWCPQRGADSIPLLSPSLAYPCRWGRESCCSKQPDLVLQLPALVPWSPLQHRLSHRHLIPATNLSLGRAQLIQAATCCCNALAVLPHCWRSPKPFPAAGPVAAGGVISVPRP